MEDQNNLFWDLSQGRSAHKQGSRQDILLSFLVHCNNCTMILCQIHQILFKSSQNVLSGGWHFPDSYQIFQTPSDEFERLHQVSSSR